MTTINNLAEIIFPNTQEETLNSNGNIVKIEGFFVCLVWWFV